MAKKKNNNIYWILGAVALIVLIYGGSQGWFKSTLTIAGDTINMLENPPEQLPGETCSISITPTTITSGQSISGTIRASPNTFCEVFGKYQGQWAKVFEGTTSASGTVVKQETITLVGDFIFKAICVNCVTSEVSLKVNPSAATDTDGDGIPDESDWDDDNDGVGDAEEIVAGTDPLNPNDYPGSPEATCSDTDDGYDLIQFGVCTDNTDSWTDGCPEGEGIAIVGENYCLDNACTYVSTACPPGWFCYSGYCQFPEQEEQPDRYTLLTCTLVAKVVAGFEVAVYDPFNDVDFRICQARAITNCEGGGKDYEDSQDYPPNCCGWTCGNCDTDACCTESFVVGDTWDFARAGYFGESYMGDCEIWAEIQCNDYNGVVAYNVIDECCVWSCWGS